eukprot:1188820-Prorocentrum_minimum.AAC.3
MHTARCMMLSLLPRVQAPARHVRGLRCHERSVSQVRRPAAANSSTEWGRTSQPMLRVRQHTDRIRLTSFAVSASANGNDDSEVIAARNQLVRIESPPVKSHIRDAITQTELSVPTDGGTGGWLQHRAKVDVEGSGPGNDWIAELVEENWIEVLPVDLSAPNGLKGTHNVTD